MNFYKHYSFDLWMTIIKSNPHFKKQRVEYFRKHFNPLNKTTEEVTGIIRHTDLMCNAINENTGKNIDAEEMYLMVIYQLGGSEEIIKNVVISEVYSHIDELVFENMPEIYSAETLPVLATIKENPGVTMSLLSNTAFLKGSTLRIVLQELKIDRFFDFQIYSDEVGISKPNPKIYEMVLNKVTLQRKNEPVQLSEVIHVGDNAIADIDAANAFGINSFHINSNDKLITDLLN